MVCEGKLCLLSLLQFIYILISFPSPAFKSQQVKVKQIYSKWKADHSAFLWKLLEKPGMGHFLWPTGQPVSPSYPSTSSDQFCKSFNQHQQTSLLLSSRLTLWEEVLALNTANGEMLPPFPPSFLPLIPPRFCDSSLTFSGSPKQLAYRTWDPPSQLAAPAPKSPLSNPVLNEAFVLGSASWESHSKMRKSIVG